LDSLKQSSLCEAGEYPDLYDDPCNFEFDYEENGVMY
jgi:hypothetical protein